MNSLTAISQRLRSKYRSFIFSFLGFGPIAPLLLFLTFSITLFFVSRCFLSIYYWERIIQEPRFYLMYLIGFRMDLIILCYYSFIPIAFFLLLPKNWVRSLRYFLVFYFTLFIDVAFFMEMATFPFLKEYDLRPDAIFIRYLKHYKEVAGTVWAINKWELIITLTLLFFVHRFIWRTFKIIIFSYHPLPWTYRYLMLPLFGGILFLGARSSLAPRPANISTAYFSEKNRLVNELTLNSTYSVLIAASRLSNEKDPSGFYGSLSEKEIFNIVKENSGLQDSVLIPSTVPFLHQQNAAIPRKRPLNVVIILEESLGAEYVGALGGLPLTPNIDKLSKEGLFLTNLYSTGTRTVRGIEAVVTGFLPTPGNSIVNLGLSRSNFFTGGALFKKQGYATEFIYGGQSNFDEMRSFFISNGFSNIYDEPTFQNPVFKGVWGVSDEDLMRKADQILRSHGDKPFFSVILSTSNHSPYEFPDGRIQLHEQPKQSVLNAMKYADYSVGLFFELAKKSDYFKNTLFLVVADHNTRVLGDEFIPVHKFHIPGILIGPNVPKIELNKVASQIDLLPTILHFAGVNTVHPMIGKDLMTLNANDPGRAIMQYSNNYGYLQGDSLIVLKPYLAPQAFRYDKVQHKLSPAVVSPTAARRALAHALLPWKLYESKRYRID